MPRGATASPHEFFDIVLGLFQQPIKAQNIGALIGRTVLLVSIEVDEETGEETRNEIIKEFFIGEKNRIRIPLSGRLYLGINEDLVVDNAGQVFLFNCFNITIQDLNLSNTSQGLGIFDSRYCVIFNNTINSNSREGLYLSSSDYNSIINNTIYNNKRESIYLRSYSLNNIIDR